MINIILETKFINEIIFSFEKYLISKSERFVKHYFKLLHNLLLDIFK